MPPDERSALLVVDVQRDFCEGGALAVPGGDRVVEPLNRLTRAFRLAGRPVYFSRDWHPTESTHFATHGGPWPVHCVAHTAGAAFHADLDVPEDAVIITKGAAPGADGYSALEGHTPTGQPFPGILHDEGVTRLYVAGLATDYCVKHSVLDARRLGLEVRVVTDAMAGVDLQEGDSTRAIESMTTAGALLTTAEEVEQSLKDSA